MGELIGVFGGTFDPPHNGHLALARHACRELGLDRVLWVLTPKPPHKPGGAIAPVEDRLAMLRLAIAGEPAFEISRVDLDRPPPLFAVDTVRLIHDQYAHARLCYLMGADSLRDLPTWHDPAGFVDACDLIGVMRRPGVAVDLAALDAALPGLAAKVRTFKSPMLPISAHELRSAIGKGSPTQNQLPESVAAYIRRRGLYR